MCTRSEAEQFLNGLAGLWLIFGVGVAFVVSIMVLPELNWRAIAQSSEPHREAAIILRSQHLVEHELAEAEALLERINAGETSKYGLAERISSQQRSIAEKRDKIDEVAATLVRFKGTSTANKDAAEELQQAVHSWRCEYLAQATPNQLVLLLTLCMGFLGGIIAVTRAFLTPDPSDQPAPADYLIRPLMGMVVAFVFFILVQVGQNILVVDGQQGWLNAYPIAMIAVVAGMMAGEALGAIDSWGKALIARVSTTPVPDPLTATLDLQRNRLAELEKRFPKQPPPTPGTPPTPVTPEFTEAKAAFDAYGATKIALADAKTTLTATESAVTKAVADGGAALRSDARKALESLKDKITDAEAKAKAIPTP